MTANIYYDEKKECFVMYYQGKRHERQSLEGMLELVKPTMQDMRLEHLYAKERV